MKKQILARDPATYVRHLIHGGDRVWAETNCAVDVWVELLHAWGHEPIAALPFTLAIDFEGDQWTFFKFPLGDLEDLFGLEVQELAIWRPMAAHLAEQIERGRPVLVELDSFHLPDTAGTAYRREHVKSTVAAVGIDEERGWLAYFHNQGYYHLEGEDYAALFSPRPPEVLPPYVEFVKRTHRGLEGTELVRSSVELLRRHLGRVPRANPFPGFRVRFEADLPWLASEPLDTFHRYSFATLRQCGACYELAATYLHWARQHAGLAVEAPAAALADLAGGARTLQFQLARSVARGKPLNLSAVDHLAELWERAMGSLRAALL